MIRRIAIACLLAALAVPAVRAADDDDTLKAGKNAPELKPKKLHQGELPTLNTNEGCVVVEFWATWCGPCMRSIPKLNKLYNELGPRGLQVIGVSDDETEKVVSEFLKKKGSQMAYPVASDKDGDIKRTWMQAAKQNGIPCAFLIGRGGRVLWIGNPLDDNFEPNVRKAMAGRFDPTMRAKMDPIVKAAQKCADVRNFAEAYVHYDEALDVDSSLGLDVAMERFKVTLLKEGNTKGAFDWLADTAKRRYASDTAALGDMVALVLKDPEVKPHSVETAERLLEVLGTKGGPKGLAIQAMVAAAKGDNAKAIELQTDAWMSAIPADKPALKRALDEYRLAATRASASADPKRGG